MFTKNINIDNDIDIAAYKKLKFWPVTYIKYDEVFAKSPYACILQCILCIKGSKKFEFPQSL